MSVYIKGMPMYEVCVDTAGHWSCPLFGSCAPYGYVCKNGPRREIKDPFSHQPWCPLVPVPDHGKLVDADEFLNRAFRTGLFDEDDMRLLLELAGGSPTIIPASGGKENE